MSGPRPNWFVAWPVDPGRWFERLPAPPAETRLFAPVDLHLTVAFFGAVEESAARAAFAAVRGWPAGASSVRLGPVRAFGSKRRPSALSAVPTEGAREVAHSIGAVRDALLEIAGARPDRRPPRPHVTLARISRRASADQRRAALDWAEALDLGGPEIRLDRVALYTWAHDRRTALFRITEVLPLASDSSHECSARGVARERRDS